MGQVLQQGVYRLGEVGDKASEGQAAGVYGGGFTAETLARKGARGGRRNKLSSEKELTEVETMAEGDLKLFSKNSAFFRSSD